MIAHHRNINTILQVSLRSCSGMHHIPSFNSIMERLSHRSHKVDNNVMDNEYIADFKRVITEDWKSTFQLVPPDKHCRNIAKRAIHTFKVHFLAILAGVDSDFLRYLW